ncbi:MAG: hypothetical protein HKN33_07445 [Pyrinomonadaceae bacterium]|nr:hypothetical protein [Pyrinomonadaceae bacterium]
MDAVRIAKMIGAALIYLVLNVLVSVVVVAVYATFIDPGRPSEFYEEFAKYSAPYSSVIAGMPLMLVWAWLLRKWWSFRSVIGVWVVYAIIDISVLTASGWTSRLALFSIVSLATKLIAVILGARLRERSLES